MSTRKPSQQILIVDDEEPTLRSMQLILRLHGFQDVLTCGNGKEALEIIREEGVALLLLDLIMPEMSGEEVLARALEERPDLPVIVFTAEYDPRVAVRCMKRGATEYLLKPVDEEQLVAVIEQTLDRIALENEATRLREQFFKEDLKHPEVFSSIITSDPVMFRVFAYLEAIAHGSHPALICGETGTGKELVARALHRLSGRGGNFVAVNSAGLDDSMFSDTLFGHLHGSFTGAEATRRGMVELAGEGTLFLDEIGDLPPASQIKLLRLIQEREFFPLGSDVPRYLRARVVAATHQDPTQLRRDLYYRLRTYQVKLPPLRERLGDLPALVRHFVEEAAADLGKRRPHTPPELYLYLSNYSFPGNIRELQAMIFDAVARFDHPVLSVRPFVEYIKERSRGAAPRSKPGDIVFPYPIPELKEIEKTAVAEAMQRAQGNQTAAARMLGVSRPTVARYLKRLSGDASAEPPPPEEEVSGD